MELGLILGRNLEKPGKRQNLGVFQGFSRFNFLFLPFSRFSRFSRSPGNPGHAAKTLIIRKTRRTLGKICTGKAKFDRNQILKNFK